MTSQRIIEEQVIAQLFTEARTHKAFLDKPVETATLHRLYDIAKFAPSASNLCPMRVVFATSDEARRKVIDAAASGNRQKIDSAPVVIIAAILIAVRKRPSSARLSSFSRSWAFNNIFAIIGSNSKSAVADLSLIHISEPTRRS